MRDLAEVSRRSITVACDNPECLVYIELDPNRTFISVSDFNCDLRRAVLFEPKRWQRGSM